MLLKFHVDGLIVADIHQMERSSALSDHLEIHSVVWIIKPAEFPVINTESILPKMQNSLLWLLSRWWRCTTSSSPTALSARQRIGDDPTLYAVATKSLPGASEMAGSRWACW
jgi:hypothetical protein